MSKISTKERPLKVFGDHHKFLSRIKKTLYYGKLPKTDRFSLPVTELTSDLFSQAKIGNSLERLHLNDAATISRNACVSPCSLILAMLYLERLKTFNPDYLQRVAPSELFLVSLMVSSKFLYDDGEDDEVFMDEWAASGGLTRKELIWLEKDFLNAINWEIYVNEFTFWKKLKSLEEMLAKKQGLTRGWFTYTELNTLTDNLHCQELFRFVFSFFSILLATYMAGLLTIIGSMFIVSQVPGNCLQSKPYVIDADVSVPVGKTNKCFDCDNVLDGDQIYRKLDAIDVLQTSIILASIKSEDINNNQTRIKNEEETANVEYVTWNWWDSSTMDWLSKTSKLIEKLDFIPIYSFNQNNYEIYNFNNKLMKLEDQVHKASKVRIQDQMEMSWHKEWTDTIMRNFNYGIFNYFQDMTS